MVAAITSILSVSGSVCPVWSSSSSSEEWFDLSGCSGIAGGRGSSLDPTDGILCTGSTGLQCGVWFGGIGVILFASVKLVLIVSSCFRVVALYGASNLVAPKIF